MHKEYTADRERAGLDFRYDVVTDYPTGVYQDEKYYPFIVAEPLRVQPFIATYHLGETLSLARNTFIFEHWLSSISFDHVLKDYEDVASDKEGKFTITYSVTKLENGMDIVIKINGEEKLKDCYVGEGDYTGLRYIWCINNSKIIEVST